MGKLDWLSRLLFFLKLSLKFTADAAHTALRGIPLPHLRRSTSPCGASWYVVESYWSSILWIYNVTRVFRNTGLPSFGAISDLLLLRVHKEITGASKPKAVK
jgi:hypothetical protein